MSDRGPVPRGPDPRDPPDPRGPPPRRARSHGPPPNNYSDDYSSDDSRHRDRRHGRPPPRYPPPHARDSPPPPYRSRHNSAYAPEYDSYSPPRGRRPESRGRGFEDRRDKDGRRGRSKSNVRNLVQGLGLPGGIGGLAGAALNKLSESHDGHADRRYSDYGDRRRGRSYDRYDRYDRDRGYDRYGRGGRNAEKKWQQAATAAAWAGAVEAFRLRKEPGEWKGDKGKRIATAALGAAGLDSMVDKNPRRKGKRHIAESVIGGLAGNRVLNGSRSESRTRARSRGRH